MIPTATRRNMPLWQAGIDDVKDAGVFVIATANDIRKLPSSLAPFRTV